MVKGVPTTWNLVIVDYDAYLMARLSVAISVGRWFRMSCKVEMNCPSEERLISKRFHLCPVKIDTLFFRYVQTFGHIN
jgi:hypothetical protein